ncbi:MAG: hypothetical protein EB015_19760 [Methylocystaceae bacterium]|nr:hypothetical protein [Methylocystaceae bacterium]
MNGDGTQAFAPSGLADFWSELNGDGCDMRHIQQMLSRIRIERAEAAASAARIFFTGNEDKPVSLLDLADHLRELRCQTLTLELAINGAFNEPTPHSYGEALAHQASELARAMERFERAFNAELQLIGKERSDDEEQ